MACDLATRGFKLGHLPNVRMEGGIHVSGSGSLAIANLQRISTCLA